MHALADVGVALTTLPANPDHPGVMAGLTFSLSRTALGYESPDSAAWLIAERMELLATHADGCVDALPALGKLAGTLRDGAAAWRQAHDAKDYGATYASSRADELPIVLGTQQTAREADDDEERTQEDIRTKARYFESFNTTN